MSKDKEQPATQWHPLFAELLRPMLQDYYDVQTNFPVGDVPREADIVVLRRTSDEPLPFRGLWRHLTPWNVFEFKGPSVSARLRDLDLLVELGLGIDRRLNEEERRHRRPLLNPGEVSFWYLTNNPGHRFLRAARQRFGELEQVGPGLWRSHVLERLVYLVSNSTIPVEHDSLPVHLVAAEPIENQQAVLRVFAEQPSLWDVYGPILASLHSDLLGEIITMAKRKHKGPQFNIGPLAKEMVPGSIMEQLIKTLGADTIFATLKDESLLEKLSPKDRRKVEDSLK